MLLRQELSRGGRGQRLGRALTVGSGPLWGLVLIVLAAYPLSLAGWFHDDDAVILTDAAAALNDPAAAFSPGTFGRFRPLRLLLVAMVYAVTGTRSPVPYHLLLLGLHLVNMVLMYRLLRRLVGDEEDPPTRLVPFAATAIAAVHWAGSEAVTYLSAIGILISTTGALIACLAVRRLAESGTARGARLRHLAQLAAGMLVTIGGGYVLSTIAAVFLCAIWPTPATGRRLSLRPLGPTAAVVLPLALGYGALEKLFVVRDFSQQARFEPGFMFTQLTDNLARLYLPSYFLNEPIVLGLLGATAAAVIVFRPLREAFSQPRVWLLLVLAVACLLPYAPSALGNRDRFCYLPAAFFVASLLLLVSRVLHRWPGARGLALPAVWACLVVLGVLHVGAMQLRIAQANRRGEALREHVATVERIRQQSSDRKVRLFLTTADPDQSLFMLRLMGVLTEDQTLQAVPPAPGPPDDERWIVVAHRLRQGFEVQVLPPLPPSGP